MDYDFDYLLPTCMLKNRNLGHCRDMAENDFMNSDVGSFNDTLKELESDTCSEISDKSYADASYYTRMKIWKSPYIERQFWCDLEEYKAPWERNRRSQFDKSLQQFLEWPESNCGSDGDEVFPGLDFNDMAKLRQKIPDKKKRLVKNRPSNPKRVTPKVHVISDTEQMSDSCDERTYLAMDLNACHLNISRKQDSKNLKFDKVCVPKCNKSVDSDSDYRTYSDTSCDKFDIASSQSEASRDFNLQSLKELMASVLQKSENISNKLAQSDLVNGNMAFVIEKNSRASNNTFRNKVSCEAFCLKMIFLGRFLHFLTILHNIMPLS